MLNLDHTYSSNTVYKYKDIQLNPVCGKVERDTDNLIINDSAL